MNKKKLFTVVICVLSLFAVALVLHYFIFFRELNMRGKYTFGKVKNEIADINHIKLNTPQYGEVNLYWNEGYWRFKEAGDYFVNYDMLAGFYEMVNNSVVISASKTDFATLQTNNLLSSSEADNSIGQGTEISVYNDKNKILTDLIIGNRINSDGYTYARPRDKNIIYVISAVGRFSGDAQAWLPYPLLIVDYTYINNIICNDITIDEKQLQTALFKNQQLMNLFDILQYLEYEGIVRKNDFFQASDKAKAKKIVINMIGGLIYEINVYEINNTYWATIDLKAQSIAHKEVYPFVEENAKYFADWAFQLPDSQGWFLYNLQF